LLVCAGVRPCKVPVTAFLSTLTGIVFTLVIGSEGLSECEDRVNAYAKANICVN
jgi:hypothetical protein